MYQRWDHYQYADQSLIDGTSSQWTGEALPDGITDGVKSEKADNFGYNAKAGVGLNFTIMVRLMLMLDTTQEHHILIIYT